MKRSQLIFVTTVFAVLLAGFLSESARTEDPFTESIFLGQSDIEFEPLIAPLGEFQLTGNVVTQDGEPAYGVVVHLHAPEATVQNAIPLSWTFTDEAGNFHISDLSTARYRVILLQPDYPNSTYDVELPVNEPVRWTLPPPLAPIATMPGMERAPLLGRLAPPVAAPSWPVAPYQIVFRPTADTKELSGATIRRVMTEPSGDFRIPDLVLAHYEVWVLPLWASGGNWPILDQVPFRHERASDELLLLRLRCGHIGGRLFDRDGRPVEGALVRITPNGSTERPWPAAITGPDGTFLATDLPFDTYLVEFQAGSWTWQGNAQVRIGTRVDVAPDAFTPEDHE